jgi:hypothetical protein
MQLETESYNRIERIARHFPEPLDTQIRETLQEYARTEAQARQGLRPGSESIALLNRMWLSVAEFEPGGGAQNLLQSEALLELSVLRMQRGVAARAARHEHGPLIWMVLIVGSVSIIGVCILSGAGDPHTPYYLVALTALISVSLYVLYALSRPMLAVPFQTVLNAAPH